MSQPILVSDAIDVNARESESRGDGIQSILQLNSISRLNLKSQNGAEQESKDEDLKSISSGISVATSVTLTPNMFFKSRIPIHVSEKSKKAKYTKKLSVDGKSSCVMEVRRLNEREIRNFREKVRAYLDMRAIRKHFNAKGRIWKSRSGLLVEEYQAKLYDFLEDLHCILIARFLYYLPSYTAEEAQELYMRIKEVFYNTESLLYKTTPKKELNNYAALIERYGHNFGLNFITNRNFANNDVSLLMTMFRRDFVPDNIRQAPSRLKGGCFRKQNTFSATKVLVLSFINYRNSFLFYR